MNQANPYLESHVLTAPPESLIVMLHDALIRHAQQASEQLKEGNLEAAHDALVRSQEIVTELIASLRFDAAPDLCQNLLLLYHYWHHCLAEANLHHRAAAVENALTLVRQQRDTWSEAAQHLGEEKTEKGAGDGPSDTDALHGPHSSSKSDWDLNNAHSSGNVWNV